MDWLGQFLALLPPQGLTVSFGTWLLGSPQGACSVVTANRTAGLDHCFHDETDSTSACNAVHACRSCLAHTGVQLQQLHRTGGKGIYNISRAMWLWLTSCIMLSSSWHVMRMNAVVPC